MLSRRKHPEQQQQRAHLIGGSLSEDSGGHESHSTEGEGRQRRQGALGSPISLTTGRKTGGAKTRGAVYPLQQHSCSHCALNWRVVVGAEMEVVVGPGSFKLARPATGPFLIAPTDGPGARDWDGWAGGCWYLGEATSLSERRACSLTALAASITAPTSRLVSRTFVEQSNGLAIAALGHVRNRCLCAACSLCVQVTAYFVQRCCYCCRVGSDKSGPCAKPKNLHHAGCSASLEHAETVHRHRVHAAAPPPLDCQAIDCNT